MRTQAPPDLKTKVLTHLNARRDTARNIANACHADLSDVREALERLLNEGKIDSFPVGEIEIYHSCVHYQCKVSDPQKAADFLRYIQSRDEQWVPITECIKHIHPQKISNPDPKTQRVISDLMRGELIEQNAYHRVRITPKGERWLK